ncbi:hypothetical protein [Basfia succiniciproducens]|nr:hypothetical protein [Basfia succiniciproducens]SEP87360.1 hypothetical protein SAMN02910415_00556 [Basfia succiniciproducens]
MKMDYMLEPPEDDYYEESEDDFEPDEDWREPEDDDCDYWKSNCYGRG